ncbi:hypothetical protein QO034_19535 [Sedimentitalea sp. JM2-8]|uniref:Invasion protein IalB, involved in pathogenesis n=1 Tax=Sedimentitalea xiamensis TaxID=3050037 RepID=A0ABT7FJF8_9RHOB|nr:hypothetical protein [Sedimentitalea xiamensis]MDK3075278.1 hypothetical protein [Sedimentitalea xiamensis]
MTRSSAIFAFVFLAPGATVAGDLKPWGQSGDWSILIDEDAGNGCLMQKDFDDGMRIRFGYLPDRDGGYFAALSPDWTHIEPQSTGIVKFLTDEAKFAGEVEMIKEDGWFGGRAFFNNPNLTEELAKRRSITVIGPHGGTFEVDLTGSSRAISVMKECQSKQPRA